MILQRCEMGHFFHNLANYISGESDRIFTKILSQMYPWTRKSTLNFGSNPETESGSGRMRTYAVSVLILLSTVSAVQTKVLFHYLVSVAISCPAISCVATWSVILASCIFSAPEQYRKQTCGARDCPTHPSFDVQCKMLASGRKLSRVETVAHHDEVQCFTMGDIWVGRC